MDLALKVGLTESLCFLLSILKIQSSWRLRRRVHLASVALVEPLAWLPAPPCLFILNSGQVVTWSLGFPYLMGNLSCGIIFEMANSAVIPIKRSVKCQLSLAILVLASCQSWIVHLWELAANRQECCLSSLRTEQFS